MHLLTTKSSRTRRRAFTLVEVLVTIAIISLLVALIIVTIPQVQRQSRSSVCLSNQRQLTMGFTLYYTDNAGRFMGVDTGLTAWDWVQGQSNLTGQGYETENAIKKGRMYPYIDNFATYRSPFDPFTPYQRLRTYSFNAFISTGEGPGWGGPPNWQVNTMGKIPLPSETIITSLEYDHRGYNINGFGISITGNANWVDKIAPWHPGYFNFSFADGSVLSYRYMARQDTVDYYMTLPQNDIYWPGPDYEWLRRHLAPGMFQ
ncbi:MAG: type II secretion system protein [Planctomycetota bacterium]|nr:MAG: type II secretion system protein [Planctomycetota bacterium]